MTEACRHKIVIVGGGAGGLELATRLGKTLGKRKQAEITLIDSTLTHLWKPLLHEVAAGTMNAHEDELNYMAQATWNHFLFRFGKMDRLDREQKLVSLAPTLDEAGKEYIPRREFHYDTLVIAVGSVSNDFSIPGVAEHCLFLDSHVQADKFHSLLLKRCYTAHTQASPIREGQLHVAIAGAGATGIELAAELHNSTRQLVAYGLDQIEPDKDIQFSIIEAADSILPALPKRLSDATAAALANLNIKLMTGERIVRATAEGYETQSGKLIASEIKVWAAGIKAPDFLRDIDGLETSRSNQLVVKPTLQTTRDDDIFAFGDCAACPMPDSDQLVPPRAQAAHQQASMIYKSIKNKLAAKPLPTYAYVDYGSLINMSKYSTVGSLMGNLTGRWSANMMVEGVIARLVYVSLYKMHQLALHGYMRMVLMTVANLFSNRTKPRMKLH
jgi:NADH dehydrogenase